MDVIKGVHTKISENTVFFLIALRQAKVFFHTGFYLDQSFMQGIGYSVMMSSALPETYMSMMKFRILSLRALKAFFPPDLRPSPLGDIASQNVLDRHRHLRQRRRMGFGV